MSFNFIKSFHSVEKVWRRWNRKSPAFKIKKKDGVVWFTYTQTNNVQLYQIRKKKIQELYCYNCTRLLLFPPFLNNWNLIHISHQSPGHFHHLPEESTLVVFFKHLVEFTSKPSEPGLFFLGCFFSLLNSISCYSIVLIDFGSLYLFFTFFNMASFHWSPGKQPWWERNDAYLLSYRFQKGWLWGLVSVFSHSHTLSSSSSHGLQ